MTQNSEAAVTCSTCQHIGVIYWDNGFSKTHHCMMSAKRRRDAFRPSGDGADDFMSEFRKFYDAQANQAACDYYEERDALPSDKLAVLRSVGEQPKYGGYVAAFFSDENRMCAEMSGKFVEGGSHAFPNEPARGDRRWFITDIGKAELARVTAPVSHDQ